MNRATLHASRKDGPPGLTLLDLTVSSESALRLTGGQTGATDCFIERARGALDAGAPKRRRLGGGYSGGAAPGLTRVLRWASRVLGQRWVVRGLDVKDYDRVLGPRPRAGAFAV